MRSIARRLNDMGIPNPSAYKKEKGLAYQSSCGRANDGMWSQKTVRDILKNRVYVGTMVQGRQAIISYKVHKRYNTDPADWYTVETPNRRSSTATCLTRSRLFYSGIPGRRRESGMSTCSPAFSAARTAARRWCEIHPRISFTTIAGPTGRNPGTNARNTRSAGIFWSGRFW